MEIRDLECFLEVANAGSITRAAGQLFIAQSALSRRLGELEDDLGVRLFVREWSGVSLTADGQRLKPMAVSVLAQIEKIRVTLASSRLAETGRLRLGMVSGVRQVVQDAVTRFRSQCTGEVSLTVKEDTGEQLRASVISGDLDLAITTNPAQTKGIRLTPLWRESLYIAAPKARNRRGGISISDVMDLPFILATRSPGANNTMQLAFRKAGQPFHVAMEIESISTVRQMIEDGTAWSILPYSSIKLAESSASIALWPVADSYITRTLIQRSRAANVRVQDSFVESLKRESANLIARAPWASEVNMLSGGIKSRKPIRGLVEITD